MHVNKVLKPRFGKAVRGVGFEPTNPFGIGASGTFVPNFNRNSSLERNSTPICMNIDYQLFKEWLYQNYRPFTCKSVLVYSKTYGHLLLLGNLNSLHGFTDGKRSAVIKALCTLSKFLGMHTEFSAMIKNYGLKWAGRSDDDIIIDRLSKNTDRKPLIQWIKDARKISELANFVDLMVSTGMRLIEGIECYRLIIELNEQNKLSSYYNKERQLFEHYRFKNIFIRNSKKLFINFVPYRIVEAIAATEKPLPYIRAQRLCEWHLRKVRWADIRELYASVSVKNLRESEIDFLQGRISSRVFLRNYFNPQFIDDLQERALKNAHELLSITR